jgi:hypothetical protein
VQGVVKLALEAPLELRMVEIARMKIEIVCVYGNGRVFELDNDLSSFPLGARGEVQERMLVETQLSEDAIEAGVGGFGHARILSEWGKKQTRGRRAEGNVELRGIFDSVTASLCGAVAALRMTFTIEIYS